MEEKDDSAMVKLLPGRPLLTMLPDDWCVDSMGLLLLSIELPGESLCVGKHLVLRALRALGATGLQVRHDV